MTDIFSAVDLSKLPSPDVIESLDFETIYREQCDLWSYINATSATPVVVTLPLSDTNPIAKLLQVHTYRELKLRQRINEAARAVMLAQAKGADLDNIVAREPYGIMRLTITPADGTTIPPTPAIMETDEDLRRRALLAPNRYSTAGPEGAYLYHALSADADVADASAISPQPGEVLISVLSRTGDGNASADVVNAVINALALNKEVRPLTDNVSVQSASVVYYSINATLVFYNGPDKTVVQANALNQLNDYKLSTRKLGIDITRAGIIAALKVEGIQDVVLDLPAANLIIDKTQVGCCNSQTINDGGYAQ